MSHPKPLGYYTDPEGAPLLFHLLDVGEGLMTLIVFPDETTMLYDCNVRKDDKDTLIAYLGEHIPWRYEEEVGEESQWIDIFVNSHRDQDHYRGLTEITARFDVKSIWDSGQTGEATEDSDYQYYMRLRRSLIDKYGDDAVLVPVPSRSPVACHGGASVYCLCSSQDYSEDVVCKLYEEAVAKEARIQHVNSVVLSIEYSGKSILLPSDSNWLAWKEKIVPNFKDSDLLDDDILVASHHGSRSFFTDPAENDTISQEDNPDTTYLESISYINPSITLISCGEKETANHPNAEALEIYKKNTAHEQVYTTNAKGTLAGFIDSEGNWTVSPSRFSPKHTGKASLKIGCVVDYEGESFQGTSGGDYPTGCNLLFSVRSRGGLIDPISSVDVYWEVSNGGIADDDDQQDIYYKGKDEDKGKLNFRRAVSYEGKHLLRCRVKNRKQRFDVTEVFVVNGVHV